MAYQLEGVSKLQLSPDTIAKIFQTEITSWDDAAIKADNPGVTLPATKIVVVHRAEGSGTTSNFTGFLTKAAPTTWTLGKGDTVNWPASTQAGAGNQGVAQLIGNGSGSLKGVNGAIGYVDFADAKATDLKIASIKNAAGKFVAPTLAGVSAALEETTPNADLTYDPLNAAGATAYPIATPTWILVYKNQTDKAKGEALKGFINFMLTDGQALNESVNYAQASRSSTARKALAQLEDARHPELGQHHLRSTCRSAGARRHPHARAPGRRRLSILLTLGRGAGDSRHPRADRRHDDQQRVAGVPRGGPRLHHLAGMGPERRQVRRPRLHLRHRRRLDDRGADCAADHRSASRCSSPRSRPSGCAPSWSSVMDLLAGIPSVVFGLWGILVLAPNITGLYNSVSNAVNPIPVLTSLFNGTQTGRSLLHRRADPGGDDHADHHVGHPRGVRHRAAQRQGRRPGARCDALGDDQGRRVAALDRRASSARRCSVLGRAMGETIAVALVIGSTPQITANLFSTGRRDAVGHRQPVR